MNPWAGGVVGGIDPPVGSLLGAYHLTNGYLDLATD